MACRTAKIPELAIPKFGGKFVEWPAFSEMFSFANNKGLEASMDIDRLCYLRASLTGEPSRQGQLIPPSRLIFLRPLGNTWRSDSPTSGYSSRSSLTSCSQLRIDLNPRSAPALHRLWLPPVTEVNETHSSLWELTRRCIIAS